MVCSVIWVHPIRLPKKWARGEGPVPFPPRATGSSTTKLWPVFSNTSVVAASLSAVMLDLATLQDW